MQVPFFDLTRQYKSLERDIHLALSDVLASGKFILGEQVEDFEREFAKYLGVKYALGVASGTDALKLACRSLNLSPKDEVILPANSYPSAFGVAESGVKLKLIDVGDDANIDIEKLAEIISKRTKVIIPVHLYGKPIDIFRIQDLLKSIGRSDIKIIEDAAQAHGASIAGTVSSIPSTELRTSRSQVSGWEKAGSIGDLAIFSFYPTKNLGAFGDGGMVVTDSKKIFEELYTQRQYGEKERYVSVKVSGVSRLDEVQAAILRVKLKHLDGWVRRRREIADFYIKNLEGVGDIKIISKIKNPFGLAQGGQKSKIQVKNKKASRKIQQFNNLPTGRQGVTIQQFYPVFHLFVIRTKKRDKLKKHLEKQGIGTAIHYPIPIHLTQSFKYLGYKKGDFPVSEKLSREILSLPMFPELTLRELSETVKTVESFYK